MITKMLTPTTPFLMATLHSALADDNSNLLAALHAGLTSNTANRLEVLLTDVTNSSIWDSEGLWVVIGTIIGTALSFVLLEWKDRADQTRELRKQKESIFVELADTAYRYVRSNSNMELHSSEQEFYLAMTNVSTDPGSRDVYMFMYKDSAEKYAAAFSEYMSAYGRLNHLIAQYVLVTKDYSIARELQQRLTAANESQQYRYESKDVPTLERLRKQYMETIDETGRQLYEYMEEIRLRIYKTLGFHLAKQSEPNNPLDRTG